jgi:hypothetical protein
MGSDPVFKDREMGSDPDSPPLCTPAKLLRRRASGTTTWSAGAGTATRPGLELLTSDHAVAIRIPAAEHSGRSATRAACTGTACARPGTAGSATRTGAGTAGSAASTTTSHASLHPGHDFCFSQVVIFNAVFVGHVDRVEAWWRESASATRWLSLRELPATCECYSRA